MFLMFLMNLANHVVFCTVVAISDFNVEISMSEGVAPAVGQVQVYGRDIDEATRIALYEQQLLCRYVETRAHDLFMQNLVKGTVHLGTGQEAVAAGFGEAMRQDDYTFCTYRGHNHALVRGAPVLGVLGELMGRDCGLMRGKGGSMHITSVDNYVMGSYAIIGMQLTIANGAAWSSQYRGTDQATVCFFGDGTTNIGAFHEALNFASVWNLPVVFVCENNLYMEYTPIGEVTAVARPAADRAASYGLEPIVVDGNDADAVFEVAGGALELARSGGGPSLIEAHTYRHGGHSRADPGTYRPQEEVEAWLDKDPIPRYRQRLLDTGVSESALEKIENDVQSRVDEATEEAKASSIPPEDIALTDLWADGGSAWRN